MEFDDLNEKNFLLYAMKEYDNPQCVQVEEFYDDLKKVKYIKRLFNQYLNEGVLKERLLLNHIIVLNNVFGADACATLLLFKIQDQYWPAMKAFLLFLNILREDELEHIETDVFVCKTLKEL